MGPVRDTLRQKRRRGRPRIDGDIEQAIRRLAFDGWTPAQIHRQLSLTPAFQGRVPTARTVQRVVARYGARDTGEPWSIAEADPDDAALVLPVLAEAVCRSGGHWSRFSQGLADWVVRVRRAAPDIPPAWALEVAVSCFSHERHAEPLDGLTHMLAFAPWQGQEQRDRYIETMGKVHPDWFALLDKHHGEWLISLSHEGLRDPDAVGIIIALDMMDREREETGKEGIP